MFLWARVDLAERCRGEDPPEVEGHIVEKALRNGVQVTKGSLFDTRQDMENALYLRLTSAAADISEFDDAVRWLGENIKGDFGTLT